MWYCEREVCCKPKSIRTKSFERHEHGGLDKFNEVGTTELNLHCMARRWLWKGQKRESWSRFIGICTKLWKTNEASSCVPGRKELVNWTYRESLHNIPLRNRSWSSGEVLSLDPPLVGNTSECEAIVSSNSMSPAKPHISRSSACFLYPRFLFALQAPRKPWCVTNLIFRMALK